MKLKNWKVLAAALGAAVIVGGFNAASIAGLAASATVLDTCNVRSEASATSSAVTQASKDSTVEVGDPVTNDAGETWYPVTLSDGTTGYIKSNLLNIEETALTRRQTERMHRSRRIPLPPRMFPRHRARDMRRQ